MISERADALKEKGTALDPYIDAAWEIPQKLKERAENVKTDAVRNATIRIDIIGDATKGGTISNAWNVLRSSLF